MSTTPSKPFTLPVIPEQIPPELRAVPQWVAWRWQLRSGRPQHGVSLSYHEPKWTKPPLDAKTGRLAKVDDPSTWATFDAALEFHRSHKEGTDGVGLVLTAELNLTAWDLDDAIDLETGEVSPLALELIERLASYTERSPSGTGFRIFSRGLFPGGGRKITALKLEIYSSGRYVTLTGQTIGKGAIHAK